MFRKIKIVLVSAGIILILGGINWTIQVYRNPAILVDLFAGDNYKSIRTTWEAYDHLFKRHATSIMTPKYLAALAQVESAGNPLVIPEWRWRLTTDITRIYAPASTSAGLYQYTKGTFEDAKRFCIHNHQVVLRGHIFNLKSCWFNGLYSRFWPSHAIEMTSARLHYYVNRILKKSKLENVPLQNKHKLASIIHLCGVSRGERFARRNFQFSTIPKCGTHNTSDYFRRIQNTMKKIRPTPGKLWQRFF